jgi:hypothetical protein
MRGLDPTWVFTFLHSKGIRVPEHIPNGRKRGRSNTPITWEKRRQITWKLTQSEEIEFHLMIHNSFYHTLDDRADQ